MFKKIRQIKFHAAKTPLARQRVHILTKRIRRNRMHIGNIQLRDAFRRARRKRNVCFTRGRIHQSFYHAPRTLCGRVKFAQRFNFIADEFNAYGIRTRRQPNVHDAAAPRKQSRRIHHRRCFITQIAPRAQQFGKRNCFAAFQHKQVAFKIRARGSTQHQRAHCRNHQRRRIGRAALPETRERRQRGKTQRNRFHIPRHPFVQ